MRVGADAFDKVPMRACFGMNIEAIFVVSVARVSGHRKEDVGVPVVTIDVVYCCCERYIVTILV